jgi:hypothetical protein
MKGDELMQLQSTDFFYCYSKQVSDYLTSLGINKITVAREPKSNRLFSLYYQSDELKQALTKYNER